MSSFESIQTKETNSDKVSSSKPLFWKGLRNQYFVKTPWWLKKIYPNYLWSIDTKKKLLYLTFDDGPHPVHTPKVLENLKRFEFKSSFFWLTQNVKLYGAQVAGAKAPGHDLAVHSWTHANLPKLSEDKLDHEITEATQVETDIYLQNPKFYRCP